MFGNDLYFDREGRPVKIQKLEQLLRDFAYRRVAETFLDGYQISTVWLGINHSFDGTGPPIIFETMIFGPEADELSGYQDRYTTEAAALAGHDQAVAMVREHLSV